VWKGSSPKIQTLEPDSKLEQVALSERDLPETSGQQSCSDKALALAELTSDNSKQDTDDENADLETEIVVSANGPLNSFETSGQEESLVTELARQTQSVEQEHTEPKKKETE
jgi:hypothetical protein